MEQIAKETGEKEPNGVSLIDFYSPEGEKKFQEAVFRSKGGSCIILVHPFYPFFTPSREEFKLESLSEEQKIPLESYLNNLRRIIRRALEKELPILIMERGEVGQFRRNKERDEKVIERIMKDWTKFIGEKFPQKSIFFVITHQGSPEPLLNSDNEERLKVLTDFGNRLKRAGVKKVVIGGSNFGGYNYFGSKYLSANSSTQEGFPVGVLKKYYSSKKDKNAPWKHPFEIISPEGCVSVIIRTLALVEGIDFGISNATYPQRMPNSSQIEKVKTLAGQEIYVVKEEK